MRPLITVFRLSEEERQALAELARLQNTDMSNVIRRALRKEFRQADNAGVMPDSISIALRLRAN